MFVNTGNRKPKTVMTLDFAYDAENNYYSRDLINEAISVFAYKNEFLIERFAMKAPLLLKMLTVEKLEELVTIANKYNGKILFLFDSPNKNLDKRSHLVNFYVVPNEAFGFEKAVERTKHKPYRNVDIFLKTDVVLPDELTSGTPLTEKGKFNKIVFEEIANRGKHINVKNHDYTFSYNRRFCFDEKVKDLPTGIYRVDVNGVEHHLSIDKEYHGSEGYPHFTLFEYPHHTKETLALYKEAGVFKELPDNWNK